MGVVGITWGGYETETERTERRKEQAKEGTDEGRQRTTALRKSLDFILDHNE